MQKAVTKTATSRKPHQPLGVRFRRAIVRDWQLWVLLIPALQGIFQVVAMTGVQWLIVAGLSLSMFVIMELYKLVHMAVEKK